MDTLHTVIIGDLWLSLFACFFLDLVVASLLITFTSILLVEKVKEFMSTQSNTLCKYNCIDVPVSVGAISPFEGNVSGMSRYIRFIDT